MNIHFIIQRGAMKRLITFISGFLLILSSLASIPVASALGTNLIKNPSVEDSVSGSPALWNKDNWGNNTTVYRYDSTGHSGSHSVTVTMSKYKKGDAKWYPDPVSVTANTNYTFSDWYKSNVKTGIDAAVTTTSGTTTFSHLGDVAASSSWKQTSYKLKTASNAKQITIYHYVHSNGWLTTDDFDLENTDSQPAPLPPTIQVTGPSNNSTVSGNQTITANASGAQPIAQVQFKLDGANLGSPDSTSPYSTPWETAMVPNGNHIITAVATDTSNLSTTSSPVTVNVQNTTPDPSPPPPPGPNLIPNPSLETASGSAPKDWLSSNWGSNTASFSYLNSGHTGTKSVKAEITSYTDGAANWYYNDIPVSSGKTYKYENWYQSNVDTEIDAEVVMNDGSVSYYWLGTVPSSSSWSKYSNTFTVPAGAKSMAIYQILAKKGYIISDDYSLNEYTPTPFDRGLVSVTFDDGWTNQYTNALPLLQKYGVKGTFYIISGELNDQPDYMSPSQVKNLYNNGNEIGSHSVTHPDLTTVSQNQLINEMAGSQTTLQNLIGAPVTDFAYPYGAYNTNTINLGQQYYQSQRTVSAGLNTKDSLDLTKLKIYEVDSNITQAQVKGWVDAAIAQKSWLILVYHEVANTPTDPTDDLYHTTPADLDAELSYIKNSGVATETVHQAINEILAQL